MTEVAAGLELPPFRRQTDLANWNRFAAVNYEFSWPHMDDTAARQAGFPTAIGMGYLQWSYLHNVLREWLAGHGRIVSAGCQFRGNNLRGQVLTARAFVRHVTPEPDGNRIELEIWVETEQAEKLCFGQAVVILGATGAASARMSSDGVHDGEAAGSPSAGISPAPEGQPAPG